MLAEFPDALEAVECAVNLQQSVHQRGERIDQAACQLRIGIHLGDVEHRRGDILGDAVNIASRVEQEAPAGCICLSVQVFDQVRNKVPYPIERVGARNLRGVQEPVDIYRVVLP